MSEADLSLATCKDLKIVNDQFPQPLPDIKIAARAECNEVWPEREQWIKTLPAEEEATSRTMEKIHAKIHSITDALSALPYKVAKTATQRVMRPTSGWTQS